MDFKHFLSEKTLSLWWKYNMRENVTLCVLGVVILSIFFIFTNYRKMKRWCDPNIVCATNISRSRKVLNKGCDDEEEVESVGKILVVICNAICDVDIIGLLVNFLRMIRLIWSDLGVGGRVVQDEYISDKWWILCYWC